MSRDTTYISFLFHTFLSRFSKNMSEQNDASTSIKKSSQLDASEDQQQVETPEQIRTEAFKHVDAGKKAIALKQWEEAVDCYADALDLMRQVVGESDPQMAPLLLSYGKALYELASSQAGVMGKEEPKAEETETTVNGKNFFFSADTLSDDEGDASVVEEPSAQPGSSTQPVPAQAEQAQEECEIEEPEDDYNAAWEVLDVARTIYEKIVSDLKEGEGKEQRELLAECYLALGNVSCETENFPQAIQDFTSALSHLSHLPSSSRRVASAHYQLATALEFSPNQRDSALSHVQSALDGFIARKTELESKDAAKWNQEIQKLNEKDREGELKDVDILIGDLEVKIEELKTAPEASDLVHESISHLMGTGEASGSVAKVESGPVNDLTGMVKKKKSKTTATASVAASMDVKDEGKRVTEGGGEPEAKKVKTD
ncbi:hypothetical protein L204_101787 [Cryptococcus depauperatus]|nr:hypothetical protein L204_04243 [Cryptococcus depauperatus CBS 7855]